MYSKFRNKYRSDSFRLQSWNYGWDAAYFITICTKNREFYFGDVVEGVMELNDIGKIVESEWMKTFEMRPDMNLTMGEFVIMPNHFHAIIGIGENEYNRNDPDRGRGAMHCASTPTQSTPTQSTPTQSTRKSISLSQNKFGPQSKNLASIVRGFKMGVTLRARAIVPDLSWQSLFHDHIIRNPKSLERISEYIRNNPANWKGG